MGDSLESFIGTWKSTVRFCYARQNPVVVPMEHRGPQTTPQSPSVIMSLRRNLRFSWTFSTAGLHGFTPYNGFIWLIFFSSVLRGEIPVKEWCRLLVISSKLDCKEVRARAIDELTAKKNELSPIDRIELGNKYNVPQWLPGAYADVFVRGSHLTTEEGGKLGLEITVKVLKGRDRCKRNGWNHSGGGDVIQLVQEIFPPPNRPETGKGQY